MRDEIITKETAILAKEKGFDIDCTYLWGVVGGYEGLHKWDNINRLCNEKQFSAPSQTELQKWLREVHQIEAFVKVIYAPQLNREGSFMYWGMCLTKNCIGDCDKATERKDKYEDALEGALVLALNLIKSE
jgi:hypothetical protein